MLLHTLYTLSTARSNGRQTLGWDFALQPDKAEHTLTAVVHSSFFSPFCLHYSKTLISQVPQNRTVGYEWAGVHDGSQEACSVHSIHAIYTPKWPTALCGSQQTERQTEICVYTDAFPLIRSDRTWRLWHVFNPYARCTTSESERSLNDVCDTSSETERPLNVPHPYPSPTPHCVIEIQWSAANAANSMTASTLKLKDAIGRHTPQCSKRCLVPLRIGFGPQVK